MLDRPIETELRKRIQELEQRIRELEAATEPVEEEYDLNSVMEEQKDVKWNVD